jgi:hypothetical protein
MVLEWNDVTGHIGRNGTVRTIVVHTKDLQ